ncbi:MAG: invasion associated locus B family protein [Pseudomonadota bacterium]
MPIAANAQEQGEIGNEWLRGPKLRLAQNAAPPAAAKPAPAAPSLPNGATSINETYGDWTVSCSITDGQKICVTTQSQGNSQTGQRTFAVELRVPKDGKTEGVLLMPFGLKLDDGVKLKIDDQNLGQGARFSTCFAQGCLVPVSFPTIATDAMMKGKSLIVTASNVNGGEPPVFTVPLDGFTAALKRIVELGG